MEDLTEILFRRWIAKTPILAKIIGYISLFIGIVSGAIQAIDTAGIVLPEAIQGIVNSFTTIVPLIVAFLAKIQVQHPTDSEISGLK